MVWEMRYWTECTFSIKRQAIRSAFLWSWEHVSVWIRKMFFL